MMFSSARRNNRTVNNETLTLMRSEPNISVDGLRFTRCNLKDAISQAPITMGERIGVVANHHYPLYTMNYCRIFET